MKRRIRVISQVVFVVGIPCLLTVLSLSSSAAASSVGSAATNQHIITSGDNQRGLLRGQFQKDDEWGVILPTKMRRRLENKEEDEEEDMDEEQEQQQADLDEEDQDRDEDQDMNEEADDNNNNADYSANNNGNNYHGRDEEYVTDTWDVIFFWSFITLFLICASVGCTRRYFCTCDDDYTDGVDDIDVNRLNPLKMKIRNRRLSIYRKDNRKVSNEEDLYTEYNEEDTKSKEIA